MELITQGSHLLNRTLRFFCIKPNDVMIYLLLCIVSSTFIFVIFKYIAYFNVPVLPAIIMNYLVASTLGFILTKQNVKSVVMEGKDWLPMAILIGILFIVMFFIIARSSKVAGISVTTVSSKLSVVIPIVFSLSIDPGDELSLLKISGIVTALLAVYLTIYTKESLSANRKAMVYPLLLFIGMGIVDSLVKLAQMKYIGDNDLAFFTAILFLIAFLTGVIVLPFYRHKTRTGFSMSALVWGILLGLSNFGSIYFIIKALNFKSASGTGIDSSVVFGVNNTAIVVFSVLAGYVIFGEKLLKANYAGIFLALVAIILFTYA